MSKCYFSISLALLIIFILPSPILSNPEGDSKRGKELYQLNCTPCHGKEGKGDGPVAKFFPWVQPRDHTDGDYMSSRTDEQLFITIKMGGPATYRSVFMPEWGKILSDQDIQDLVAYLRILSSPSNSNRSPQSTLRTQRKITSE